MCPRTLLPDSTHPGEGSCIINLDRNRHDGAGDAQNGRSCELLVQYGKPGEVDFKYVHYVQGYVSEGGAHLDYTADTLG